MVMIVGLTGGIGSGKTTVADLFIQHYGVPVIDTDVIARQLTQAGGTAIPQLVSAFGEECLDSSGALDRQKVRDWVFSDHVCKSQLESILHPLILQTSLAQIASYCDASYVLFAVPLLVEQPTFLAQVHRVLLVDCDESLQKSRVIARGIPIMQAESILKQQATRAVRKQYADDVIDNNTSLENLLIQVSELHRFYLQQSTRRIDAY